MLFQQQTAQNSRPYEVMRLIKFKEYCRLYKGKCLPQACVHHVDEGERAVSKLSNVHQRPQMVRRETVFATEGKKYHQEEEKESSLAYARKRLLEFSFFKEFDVGNVTYNCAFEV